MTRRSLRRAMIPGLALVLLAPAPARAYSRPGRTSLVSAGIDGSGAGASGPARLSDDGRFVAFASTATNLVAGDENRARDIFVRDLVSGTTQRVSVSLTGGDPNGASDAPAISADGRFVVFQSFASNLVQGDTNQWRDIFLFDRATRETERISVGAGGQTNRESLTADVSDDGRIVAFSSRATNLVVGDSNVEGVVDVFVRDRAAATTQIASVSTEGVGNGGTIADSLYPVVSADGRYVAFTSLGTQLVAGDTNRVDDAFVRDIVAGTTERVSVTATGNEANGRSFRPTISADGRLVAFASVASNLVPRDRNGYRDTFVHDRATRTIERVSVSSHGAEQRGGAGVGDGVPLLDEDWEPTAAISAGGRYVAFTSGAANLDAGGISGQAGVFVHDRVGRSTDRVSIPAPGGEAGDGLYPSMSSDGRLVAFDSIGSLVQGDAPGLADVFVRDRGPSIGVGGLAVARDGNTARASGWVTFSPVVLATAQDAIADAPPGARDAGGELIAASVAYRPEMEDLVARLQLASAPSVRPYHQGVPLAPHQFSFLAPSEGGTPLRYGIAFTLDGVPHEIRGVRADTDHLEPAFSLWRCEPSCAAIAELEGGYLTTGDELVVSLPLRLGSSFQIDAGDTVAGVRAFAAIGAGTSDPLATLDDVHLGDATVPEIRVEIGNASTGSPETDVVFDASASVVAGSFEAVVPLVEAGARDIWARACIGTACGSARATLT